MLLTAVIAGTSAFLGSYVKKKDENLATHEDIDKLNEQVRVVTTTTKEIEAKISGDLWDRQKQWELRRDTLFEVARCLAVMQEKTNAMWSFQKTQAEYSGELSPQRKAKFIQVTTEWNRAMDS